MINKYFIKSYDEKSETKADQKEWNDIDFRFVIEFINVLEDKNVKESFDTIFGSGIDLEKQKVIDSVRDSLENGSENEVNIWNIILNSLDKIKSGKLNNEEIVKIVLDLFSLIAKNEKNNSKKNTSYYSKSEKKTEQDIDLSKLSNDLRGLFDEDEKFYDSDYVKSEIRDLLRKKGILDDNVTSWISKKFRASLKLTYSDIDKSISDFIIYMQNRK